MEYRVEHSRWQVWEAQNVDFDCRVADLSGEKFGQFLNQPPASAFLADGSEIEVGKGNKLTT